MAHLPAARRAPSPRESLGSLGIAMLLLLPSASSEAGLGPLRVGPAVPASFRATLTSGKSLAGSPLGRAREGILLFRVAGGKEVALPVRKVRRLEPLPLVRVVLPGRKRRFPEKEARARRWVRLLYSPKGLERDRGEAALVGLGRSIRPILYKLVWTGPPEVSLRAARALKRIDALPWGPTQGSWKGAE